MLSPASVVPGQLATGDDSRPRVLDSNGVPIQYTVEGKGEPVVLIHGLYASARINWRAPGTIRALAKDYQAIALDVRGHGGSCGFSTTLRSRKRTWWVTRWAA